MKKIIILLMLTYGLQQNIFCQSFAINATGNTSDVSAILDVSSNIKGMLIPRMTTAERTAITTPANGLILYDTDDAGFWFYNGTSWQQFTTAGNTWGINGNTATNPATNFIAHDISYYVKSPLMNRIV